MAKITPQELRKGSGLKALKVAQMLDVSRMQLYNLEKGKYKLDKLKIAKLCEVYGKSETEITSIFNREVI